MNHKRKRAKNQRSGCLMCKPHKSNSFKDTYDAQTRQEKEAIRNMQEFLANIGPLDPECQEVLNKNYWELLEE